ncbi:MAG: hypothetical protein M1819_006291 [Sarea resinae]|nr:MAG: hypothetical protein M1819_006291 [Sarea resinae]
MAKPTVHFSLPSASLFKFPPASIPEVLPSPPREFSLENPFPINPTLYSQLLSIKTPVTIALLYAVTVTIVNAVNKQRKNQPWAISKTRAFHFFVVAHNVFLSVYSAWTCVGMVNAWRRSWPEGYKGENGFAETVDAFCQIHGPRGLGNAIPYNITSSTWGATNPAVKLAGGSPDSSDLGRLWNEGLAFYGWLFYLSKFYEVLDTAIILAKGKRSSTLQTYHHAGAMMCMWAGIRYMAPPIWMFVLVNAAIHSLMYSYYTLSALGIRVPQRVKRSLTTLQICQFVVGVSFALTHLFISYDVPVTVPYTFVSGIPAAASKASSAVTSAATSLAEVATASAGAGVGGWLKKVGLRAAGEEGLAENVRNSQGDRFGSEAVHAAQSVVEDIRYRKEFKRVSCVDTTGEAFAIYLNVLYLAPLTWLFVRFFIRSYSNRSAATKKTQSDLQFLEKVAGDAVKGVYREADIIMKSLENGVARVLLPNGEETEIVLNGDVKLSNGNVVKAQNGHTMRGQNGSADNDQNGSAATTLQNGNGHADPQHKSYAQAAKE